MGTVTVNDINLIYDVNRNGQACICRSSGRGSVIAVPEFVAEGGENIPVVQIGKKAFLGCKGLREVILPPSVKTIDDWAFSQCTHLRKITIPALLGEGRSDFKLGRRVFEGCTELSQICEKKDDNNSISYLCAALVSRLPAEYLLWDDDIGSSHWYEKWDLALTAFILRRDNEGYTDTILCGEEDISYDGIGSVDGELLGETYEYVKKVAKNKSFLCLMRLVHDEMLSADAREVYRNYINAHRKGAGNEAAWLTLSEDVGDDLKYYKAYLDVANLSADELTEMVSEIGEDKAQARAYLISLRPRQDVFDMFAL